MNAVSGTVAAPVEPPAARPPRPPAARRRKNDPVNSDEERDKSRTLVDALITSRIYQDYERAFTEATGLPVALRPVESWQLPHHGHKGESPLCALVAGKSKACAMCLQVQEKLVTAAQAEPASVTCEAGLCDTAVPVRLGEKVVAFLQTGQVLRRPPTERQFRKVQRLVKQWGIDPGSRELRDAFFGTRVVPHRQHESVVKLLSIFAQHLSLLSNQIVLQQENAEPPVIRRAKEFIREHQTEALNLTQVARAVNTSTFYFCKVFKKATGINFTDYLARVRIEKSKNLLLNPNLRVSEIAFEVGFQSLTHFNRVFKKVMGQSPTAYRARLLGG